MDKIAESLEGDITIEPDWLSEHVGVLPEDQVRIDPEVWAQLAGFVERREAIRAEYQTFTGHVSEYTLQPYHLLAYHGDWYVFARNMAKNRVATFAISRFRRIEPTGSSFTLPVDFDPRTYANNAFGITGGEKPIKVRLLFEPKLSFTLNFLFFLRRSPIVPYAESEFTFIHCLIQGAIARISCPVHFPFEECAELVRDLFCEIFGQDPVIPIGKQRRSVTGNQDHSFVV